MDTSDQHWQVTRDLAERYMSPLDRRLFCDNPLIGLLGKLPGKSVLDMGCGNGGVTVQLAKANRVIGIDTSEEMLVQARQLITDTPNIIFQTGDAEHLSFQDQSFDSVVGSMLINVLDSRNAVVNVFREASRVLRRSGRFVIAMPNPNTLDQKTSFRWTQWREGQSQQTLTPGEEITRQFVGKDGETLTVKNYYWPVDILQQIATKYDMILVETFEPKATTADLQAHPELEPIFSITSFFTLLAFDKKEQA